jgi:phospholipid/cholesterol/gamma-HCH transport system permease protein
VSDDGRQRGVVRSVGARVLGLVEYFGALTVLLGQSVRMGWAGSVGKGSSRRSVLAQMMRVGVRSLGIVALVQFFMGVILALQMAPPLEEPYKQSQLIANIIGVAGFRMLGPIITAVVLSGFAGASIAAELGTMVVAEEIEALRAHALNPVRFLVVPRVLATFVMMILLTIISDWIIALGGYVTAYLALPDKVHRGYWTRMAEQLRMNDGTDFASGLIMAGVFGLLISLIACHEGLRVRGGAAGVGRATTMTVVYSIVGIIAAACLFTMVFYVYGF